MTLEEIVRDVPKPQRPDSIAPLSERSTAQMAKARQLLAEQRITEATLALDRAARFDPNHPEVHAALASLHWQAENIERAKTHAVRAIEANPDLSEAQFIIGRTAAAGGDHPAAIRAYRTALLCSDVDRDPGLKAFVNYYLAESLAAEGYVNAAINAYESFATAAKSIKEGAATTPSSSSVTTFLPSAQESMSVLHERMGRYGQAADALRLVAQAKPNDTALAVRYARLLAKSGRPDEALAATRAIRPVDRTVLDLLAEIHAASGHPERIIDDLRELRGQQPNAEEVVQALADALVRADRSPDAVSELRLYLTEHPDAHSIRLRLVDRLTEQAAWDDVLRQIVEGIQRPGAPRADYEKKMLNLAQSDAVVVQLLDEKRDSTDDFASAYVRGWIAQAANSPARAESLLKRSIQLDAAFIPARVALANIYLKGLRYDDAIIVATRNLEQAATDANLEFLLGTVHERLDQLEDAEVHFRAATQLDRASAEASFELAKVYRRLGRANLAQRQLQVLLEQHPSHEGAREHLAAMFVKDGKLDAAIEQCAQLKRLVEHSPALARCETIVDPQLRRDPEARRTLLREAIAEQGADANTWLAIADTYDSNDALERQHAYLKALEIEPENEDAAFRLAEVEEQLLNYEAAATRFEHLLKRRPNRHAWRLELIDIYSVVQDDERALALAEPLANEDGLSLPELRDYRLRVISSLRRMKRDDEIMRRLQAWAEADPDQPEWSNWLADEFVQRKDPVSAVPILERLSRGGRSEIAILGRLADALVKSGRYERAAQLVLDRVDEDPESDGGVWMLAAVLEDGKRDAAAIELVRNWLLRTENREAFQDLITERLRASKRYGEAIEWIESLIDEVLTHLRASAEGDRRRREPLGADDVALQPNEPYSVPTLHNRLETLRVQLGISMIAAKEFRDADQRITEWLDDAREPAIRARYLWLLGTSQRERGDEAQAAETFRRVLLLQPDNVSLNNDVAYGLIDQGIELELAERMIRFAIWRAPREAAYLDTFGWLLYKKGEFAEAKKWLRRSHHARATKDPVILDHLGDVCWRLGESADAQQHWTDAVELIQQRAAENDLRSADERRVKDGTPRKVEDAKAGRAPAVAPLAQPPAELIESPAQPRPSRTPS